MAWGYEKKKCKNERCGREIEQSMTGGRVREYCDSTCRSAQSRLNAEREQQRKMEIAERERFMTAIAGTHPNLHTALHQIEKAYGRMALQRVVEIAKMAQEFGNVEQR